MARRSSGPRKSRESELAEQILAALKEMDTIGGTLSSRARTRARELLAGVQKELDKTVADLDHIKEPRSFFDPADPVTAGRLVALALLTQPRVPLGRVERSYGSGVYAIYYTGKHPLYAPIANSETPIYVGKADSDDPHASTPRMQGDRLYGRLNDHRKMIKTVEHYAQTKGLPNGLRLEDFECRKLVTATNAQMFAEQHLINIFRPLWNKETNICWGISKHGDREGRSNSRSPWDVLHPGREWAMDTRLKDSKPISEIEANVADHLAKTPIYRDREHLLEVFLEDFRQDPLVASTEVIDDGEPTKEDTDPGVEDAE